MKMKVSDLRKALEGISDDVELSFQGNEQGSEYEGEEDEYLHTVATGHVFSAFFNGQTFVIDCAITDSEF